MILERIEGTAYSRVLKSWEAKTAVCIGGGPSITDEQIQAVRMAHEAGSVGVIAINAAYLLAPWADVCYFADARFWQWHQAGIPIPKMGLGAGTVARLFSEFAGEKCSIVHSANRITDPAVHILLNLAGYPNNGHSIGLSTDPTRVATGRHSGYQAINIAVLAGAKKLLLIGYDGAQAKNGQTHFHGGHPNPIGENAFRMYRQSYADAEKALKYCGAEIVNCSPGSAINAFRKSSLWEELQECDQLSYSLE